MNKIIMLILAAIISTACHHKNTVQSNSFSIHERLWDDVESDLVPRYTIRYQCSGNDIKLQCLKKQGRYPVSVLVTGCGHSSLYERQLRRHHGRLGALNTTWIEVASN